MANQTFLNTCDRTCVITGLPAPSRGPQRHKPSLAMTFSTRQASSGLQQCLAGSRQWSLPGRGKSSGLQSEAGYLWEGTWCSLYLLADWLGLERYLKKQSSFPEALVGRVGGAAGEKGVLGSSLGTRWAPRPRSSHPYPGEWEAGLGVRLC